LNIAKLEKKFVRSKSLSYLEISKPNLRNNLKQLFAMKNLILILALAVSSLVSAQNVPFTIVNDVDTDMVFFDILTIDPSTGEVNKIAQHRQAFNGTHNTNLDFRNGQILIIQKRTHPERQLLDEFSASVQHGNENKLSIIEQPKSFRVVEGMDLGQAISAFCNQPIR
jgi:hypothetical protein